MLPHESSDERFEMEELLDELKGLTSVEELMRHAKEQDFEIDPGRAQEIFSSLQANKLDDDLLESISGGADCSSAIPPIDQDSLSGTMA